MSGTIERRLAGLLRAGMMAAGVAVACGALWFLAAHGGDRADFHTFHGSPGGFSSVSTLLRLPLSGEGRGIIQLGILILVATPIARVALSVAVFARTGDRRYLVLTGIVLSILLYSVFVGH
jgi:uncharacterized membrane protein